MTTHRTRILVADDQERTLRGLIALLGTWSEVEVIGQARDGLQAVRLARALEPDIVLMDARMPGMGGLEATRHIKEALPNTKVIVLTMYPTCRENAHRAGADAFLPKGGNPNLLIATIRNVLNQSTLTASKASVVS